VLLGCSRLFDFSPELVELFGRQPPVVVVVESLDKVQSAMFGELEFRLQNADRRLETDVLFATSHTTPTFPQSSLLRPEGKSDIANLRKC